MGLIPLIIGCKTNKKASEQSSNESTEQQTKVKKYKDPGRLSVTLKPEADPKVLESEFQDYLLAVQSQTSRSQNRFLFNYDMALISEKKLIKKLNKHLLVLVVETISLPKGFIHSAESTPVRKAKPTR